MSRISPSTGINRIRWRFLSLLLNHWHSALHAKLSQSANALILVSYSYCLELSSKKSIGVPLTCNWNYLLQISTKISPLFEYASSRKMPPTNHDSLVSFENFRDAWINISLTTHWLFQDRLQISQSTYLSDNVTLTFLLGEGRLLYFFPLNPSILWL